MKIPLKDILLLFQNIQKQLNISYVSIVIFVAVDVDSICTLKIFSKIFKCQNIQYKVYPVTTYSELAARIQQSRAYEEVKMFMFINCGGIVDLTEYWIVEQQKAQILLFDVNKPIHHKNIESPRIKIIDDGFSELQNCPTSEQIQKYQELNEYDLDIDQDDPLDDIEERVDGSPKRTKKREFREKLRKHKDLIYKRINKYYGRHFFSYPSSYSAYRMVRDLDKLNNDFLWYAIIGLTSMYLQQKISKEVLDSLSQVYRSDVSKLNVVGQKRQKGQISMKKGFQFTLLDHWSLYESMLNSNYLMINLHLWEEKGVNRLNELIHHIGISLQQAKQLYKYMPRESQLKLENNIIPIAQKFNLLDVVYMSFQRQVDYSAAFMASDYHYILTSALEAPPKAAMAFDGLPDHRVRCFWQAYDLFEGSLKDMGQRIEDYKRMTRILMTETRNILQRDHLITMKSVSIANIRNDTDDKKIFEHPSALIRIAYLLMGILKEKKKAGSYKPFIANWIDLQKEICTVVGVMMESKNSIGTLFNQIAQKLKIEVSHDNFMANIITIKKDHLSEFIKEIGNAHGG